MKEKENSKDQKEFEELTEDELKIFNLIKAEKSKQIKELLNTELPPIKIWEYKTKENDGSTILHFAILYNNTKIISRIIKYSQHFLSQIDFINFINKKNKAGIIPIHYASYKGNVKIIDLLITCGSEVNTKTEKLLNVIHYSCQGNNPNCLLYYSLKYDFDFNLPDKRNSTPLHWACYSSAYECVNFLLQKNVNLNTQDIEGNTPLHLAIMGGMSKIVRLLLQKGSSIDIKNNSGLTPLQYALKEKRIEIYNIILTNKKWALCNLKAPAKKITKSKNNLQGLSPIDKSDTADTKKTLSNLWGIDGVNDQVVTINKKQHSIIVELESIEYGLLHDDEKASVSRELVSISQMLKFPIQFLEVKEQIDDIDKKRVRAICEPSVKDETTGETWLDYYNAQIHEIRSQIQTLQERINEYDITN